MNPKATVFGSKIEKSAFASVQSQWSDRFNIYLSLPFSNIIDFFDGTLQPKEQETLLKTSVDFTLANKQNDKPILSVEFDGIGCGFDKDGVYVPTVDFQQIDPYRKLKLDLKLKVCKSANYPLVVVSYDELTHISQQEQITVLDGIIGQILSNLWIASAGGVRIADDLYRFANTLPPHEREMAMGDIGTDTEFISQMQLNPVYRHAADLFEEVVNKRLCTGWQAHYLSHPRFGPNAPEKVGVTVTAKTPNGERSTSVWLRNVNTSGIDVTELAELIGRIRVFTEILAATPPKEVIERNAE